jgi:GNAT superfamily N-acetyltransferase
LTLKDETRLEGAIRIRELPADEAVEKVAVLAEVLIDCVSGGACVGFMAPLAQDKAEAFWRRVAESGGRGERVVFVAEESATGAIVGTAQLILDLPENQPHRGEVAKVLVRRRARKKGVGAALMKAIEQAARKSGKTLLALDTTSGADADRLYERLGWTRFGIMPGHALWPDGQLSDTAYFYKRLA